MNVGNWHSNGGVFVTIPYHCVACVVGTDVTSAHLILFHFYLSRKEELKSVAVNVRTYHMFSKGRRFASMES